MIMSAGIDISWMLLLILAGGGVVVALLVALIVVLIRSLSSKPESGD
jgi:hypothetical protein